MKKFLLLLLLLSSCVKETMPSDNTIIRLLHTEPELTNFLTSKQISLEKHLLTPPEVAQHQQRQDSLGEWFRRIPQQSYLSVTASNENKTQFLIIIDPEKKQIVQFVGIVTVQLS